MKLKILLMATLSASPITYAHDWDLSVPDSHAPIGVMGDHTHNTGELMLSYRYMNMNMSGNRDGNNRLSAEEVLNGPDGVRAGTDGFIVTPLRMTMEMHMFGAMYAVDDKLTLMGMLPYVKLSMDHVTRTGANFTTEAEGIGDIRVGGMYKFHDSAGHRWHTNLAVSLPTGDISTRDTTPMGSDSLLPYPMRLGSGTYDLMPGITYLGQSKNTWSWGSQATATIHLGENRRDYTLGDRYVATTWVAKRISSSFSMSARLNWSKWNNIDGADPDLLVTNPMNGIDIVPTARTDLRAGRRTDLGVGVNYLVRSGFFKGHRLAIEYSQPIQQNLDGPQLEVDNTFHIGWQKTI